MNPLWNILLAVVFIMLFAFTGCTGKPKPDEGWRSVPSNCAVEYDKESRIMASYCKVD